MQHEIRINHINYQIHRVYAGSLTVSNLIQNRLLQEMEESTAAASLTENAAIVYNVHDRSVRQKGVK